VSIDEAVGRRRRGALVTALIVLVCALVVPAAANAELFIVDSTADEVEGTLGDFVCQTAGGKCTLRAAIEESNSSLEESDEIIFEEEVFEGQAADTIALGSSLPTIVAFVRINGRECPTAAGVNGPCVGIDGPGAGPALTVEDTDEVEIEGLAITGAQTGINVESSGFFKIRGSWLGVKLDGSAGGNTTGILLGPESDNGRIGGEGPEAGNVFANSSGDGLDIHGASNARVLGNYFGIEKDGVTEAANDKNIEVTAAPGEGLEATGTAIGTKVSAEAAVTPACDRGCNLISGADSSGIDLEGDGGLEGPAGLTTIAGNYIGLNATGTAAVPNAAAGIRVGRAAQTVIGGPKAGEANRINGGEVAVLAGPAAADLVVRGNLIGVDAAGTGSLAPPDDGIVVNSEEFASAAVEATIVDNEIRMEGGVAVSQQGFGARISGNEISGAETGIRTFSYSGEHGNLIEGNSIAGIAVNGILVENGFNEILANEVSGAGGAGILIRGSLPFDVTENLVGGDTAAEENVIAGSGGDAIQISNVKLTANEVARNRGILNGGLFINLVSASPGTEPIGPNNGIEPPVFSAATQASASGSAKAGANVRVFRKQIAEVGELESFLGEATADAEGNWKVVYGGAIPTGAIVAATQTSEGGTSELSVATTSVEGSGSGGDAGSDDSGGGSGNGTSNPADTIPPQTKIIKAPKRESQRRSVRFRFDADELGSIFQCKLDDRPFGACRSPKKYKDLKPGKHVFKVRAIDPAGNLDPSPAKKKFTILER
jgi:CSLREA domain-containing protein